MSECEDITNFVKEMWDNVAKIKADIEIIQNELNIQRKIIELTVKHLEEIMKKLER